MGRSNSTELAKTRLRHFQKRKQAVVKQASQLQTLCDVDVSIITFSPKIDEPQPPEIWPPGSDRFLSQIEALRRQSPEEKRKRTIGLDSYLKDQKCCSKQSKKNWNLNYNDLPEETLVQIVSDLDSKIRFINGKLADHHQSHLAATDLPSIESQYLFEQPAAANHQFDDDNEDDLTFDFSTVFPDLMMSGGGDDDGFECTDISSNDDIDDGFEWTDFNSNDEQQQIGYYSGLVQQIMMQHQYPPSNPMPSPPQHMDLEMQQYQDPTALLPPLPPLPPIIQYQCPVMPPILELRRFPSSYADGEQYLFNPL